MHDDSGGLVDDQQVLVLVGDRRTAPARPRFGSRLGRPRRCTITRPGATEWRLGRSRPSTRTRPGSISAWAWARDPSGSARKRSSRIPAASSPTGSSRGSVVDSPALRPRRALEHVQQRQHPERDRHVGDVERRPQRQLDEVGHRAVDQPVDQVARARPRPAARSAPTATAGSDASRSRRPAPPARPASAPARARRRPRRSRTRRRCCGRGRGCTPGRNLCTSPDRDAGDDEVLGHPVDDQDEGRRSPAHGRTPRSVASAAPATRCRRSRRPDRSARDAV